MSEAPDFRNLIGETYLDEYAIEERVRQIARQISEDYAGREPLLLSILKGAIFFLADLVREVTIPVTIDFIAISSYRKDQREGGDVRRVRFLKDLDQDIEGRDLLIVEDVIDTGLTLNYIVQNLWLRNPATLEIATLLDRPYRRLADLPVKYQGFQVPDEFFVGYGFDYKQKLRNLPRIVRLNL
ncbi:MAG: hypoxanthine phosphoribosyltransferase [Actinobacteria bacterium]|nr:hypoxanthine phosphoribosyltransferase [Actinomycetota bacterium]MCL5883108.1 hypoxanthine phosphoribosyltransferase [Actinomycetota bacterium]